MHDDDEEEEDDGDAGWGFEGVLQGGVYKMVLRGRDCRMRLQGGVTGWA